MANVVILIGHLGGAPEVKQTPAGKKVATLRMATRGFNGAVDWHRVEVWDRAAEFAEKYLEKGRLVYVRGRIKTQSWTTNEGEKRSMTFVVAEDLQALGKAQGAEPQASQADDDLF